MAKSNCMRLSRVTRAHKAVENGIVNHIDCTNLDQVMANMKTFALPPKKKGKRIYVR